MRRFDTPADAAAHLGPLLDRPVPTTSATLAPGITFHAESLALGSTFTNSYTATWHAPARADVLVTEPPVSTADHARRTGDVVTTTAGFFFLADRCRHRPRTLSLNLAIRAGRVLSVPVATQDALVSRDGVLSVVEVPARGELSLSGQRLRWAGSRTAFDADCLVYGNANCAIQHQPDERTGKVRVFQEESRLTPPITDDRWTDLGFHATPDGRFAAVTREDTGRVDVFAHDVVVRCPRSAAGTRLDVHTIGPLTPGDQQGAISVGPSLAHPDPVTHPLNDDRSLGSYPLLRDRASTRLVFYETGDGARHLRLFDGRPGSTTFPGLTLEQTLTAVRAAGDVVSGCLLDSGNTSKLTVLRDGLLTSHGNRHYLRWPPPGETGYTWTPDHGRPVASLIALRPPA
ncbi:hypothetical protein ACFFQW_33570 [Umezawaea endophytica]|uniref:Uncharacterized protein n=1 Tax=Umezawaea endophytica TaxID=1654476 RepID=A0A9X2VQU3_9PSEU|nr:hypothetical protein [Umezawaea endophytica]MCS7480502.1 hypothetical protein [Umezawaea endophytica]